MERSIESALNKKEWGADVTSVKIETEEHDDVYLVKQEDQLYPEYILSFKWIKSPCFYFVTAEFLHLLYCVCPYDRYKGLFHSSRHILGSSTHKDHWNSSFCVLKYLLDYLLTFLNFVVYVYFMLFFSWPGLNNSELFDLSQLAPFLWIVEVFSFVSIPKEQRNGSLLIKFPNQRSQGSNSSPWPNEDISELLSRTLK